MARSPQEIFGHHAAALMAGDLEEIVADYADDAVIITPEGAAHGPDGVREAFRRLLTELPDATWDVPTQVFDGDVLFIEWSAVSKGSRVTDGVNTFVFAGDRIRVQTIRRTLERTDPPDANG
jgi:ketosteroid isomerase-like protein